MPNFERMLERILGFEEGRLIIETEQEVMPGKAMLAWSGEPGLTREESDRVEAALGAINDAFGGRPMIKATGKA